MPSEADKEYLGKEFALLLQTTFQYMAAERNSGSIKGGRVIRGLIELEEPESLIVIGDLHGDLLTLDRILHKVGHTEFLSNEANKMIFLGDYVDRGSHSIDLLARICTLKNEFPDSVIFMKGNHEAPHEFPFASHTLLSELFQRFGVDMGRSIYYDKVIPFFKLLYPMVIIKKRLIFVHGGLPSDKNLQHASNRDLGGKVERNAAFLEDILWSDPHNLPDEEGKKGDSVPSLRGYGKYFGIHLTERWLKRVGAVAVIRGHEPCQGFSVEHDGLVLTIFSSKEPYPAFGASYLRISRKELQLAKNAIDLSRFMARLD